MDNDKQVDNRKLDLLFAFKKRAFVHFTMDDLKAANNRTEIISIHHEFIY